MTDPWTPDDPPDAQLSEAAPSEEPRAEAMRSFVGSVAHDLNNALTVIVGYSDLLLSSVPETAAGRREAEEIRRAARSAATLTDLLLAWSRQGAPAGPATPIRMAAPARGTPAPAGARRRSDIVLLVEDDAAVRSIQADLLRRSGRSVLEAANGAEALRVSRLHPGPIHVLMTDLVMPGMGGRELASELVRLRPDIRVLFFSGYPVEIRDELLDGRHAFLRKPFSPAELERKLREVLEAPVGA